LIRADTTGIVLAGGRGSRMNGDDKGLLTLDGRPMIEHVIAALRPQVKAIVISANRNRQRYAMLGFPVVADMTEEYLGPLAGISSALQIATTDFIATAPCDVPLLSSDLVSRLSRALDRARADVAVAHDGTRLQPVFLLLRRSLSTDLTGFLNGGGRAIHEWIERHPNVVVDFSDCAECFANINDPVEHRTLEMRLRESRC
jgi:molybdopterin-guanine dinucleotide biosynthesis protein A